MTLLDRLEPSSAAPLLAFIRRSDWSSVSYDTRLTVLHQINDRITRMRERHGLSPFDDPLPGQPDNVFQDRSIDPRPFAGARAPAPPF